MDFGNILSRAWQISWKHKALWLFGVLASCGRQSGSSSQGFNFSINSTQFADPGTMPPGMERFFWQLNRSLENITSETVFAITLAIFAIVMIAVVVFAFFNVFGRLGLINGTLMAESGAEINVGSLSRESLTFFWRSLGLNILLNFVVFAIVGTLVFVGVLFSFITLGIGMLCFIPLICLLLPLSLVYYVYIEVANVALVTENLGVMEAASRGYAVLRANLAELAMMALILVLGGGLLAFVISLPIVALFFPLLIAIFTGNDAAISGGFGFLGIGLIIGIPLLILAQGILRTFLQSAWTLTYQELAGKTA